MNTKKGSLPRASTARMTRVTNIGTFVCSFSQSSLRFEPNTGSSRWMQSRLQRVRTYIFTDTETYIALHNDTVLLRMLMTVGVAVGLSAEFLTWGLRTHPGQLLFLIALTMFGEYSCWVNHQNIGHTISACLPTDQSQGTWDRPSGQTLHTLVLFQ